MKFTVNIPNGLIKFFKWATIIAIPYAILSYFYPVIFVLPAMMVMCTFTNCFA